MATILLIEDDPSVRFATMRVLGHEGYSVTGAADGGKGLETYRRFSRPPDLVITNTRMPRMDGFEVIRRIRELRPEQPIIQITGHPGANPGQAYRGSAVPVLTKPFDADALIRMVSALV